MVITIRITDEEYELIRDLKYHCKLTQGDIFRAGLALLKDRIIVKLT